MSGAYRDHLTPDQLDAMDSRIPAQAMILADQVESLLRDTCAMFQRSVGKDGQRAIAKRLIENGYRYKAIKNGLNRIVDSCDSFPAYADLVNSIRQFSTLGEGLNNQRDLEYEKEQQKLENCKQELLKIAGPDALPRLLSWWTKNVLGEKYDEKYHQKFIKCALFDWFDAGMGANWEKIKTIGVRKMDKVREKLGTNTAYLEKMEQNKINGIKSLGDYIKANG